MTFVGIDVGLVRRTIAVLGHGERLDREWATLVGQESETDDRHARFFELWADDLDERVAANTRAHRDVELELAMARRRPSIAEQLARYGGEQP